MSIYLHSKNTPYYIIYVLNIILHILRILSDSGVVSGIISGAGTFSIEFSIVRVGV